MTPAPTALPFLGVWRLKRATATSAVPVPIPQEGTVRFVKADDGFHYTADSTYSNGQNMHAEMIFQLDGKVYPLRGSLFGDSMSIRAIDTHSFECTMRKGDVVTGKVNATVSADGAQLTGKWEIYTPQGTATFTSVSERQQE
jgi:hypothetical protein